MCGDANICYKNAYFHVCYESPTRTSPVTYKKRIYLIIFIHAVLAVSEFSQGSH